MRFICITDQYGHKVFINPRQITYYHKAFASVFGDDGASWVKIGINGEGITATDITVEDLDRIISDV